MLSSSELDAIKLASSKPKRGLVDHPFFQAIASLPKHQPNAILLFRLLAEAHPFVFDKTVSETKLAIGLTQTDGNIAEAFSLPFKTSLYLIEETKVIAKWEGEDAIPYAPLGILTHEISPEVFKVITIGTVHSKEPQHLLEAIDVNLNRLDNPIYRQTTSAIHQLTNAISTKRIGIEKNLKFSIKNKNANSGFTTVKYPNVFHIADKREYEYSRYSTGKINWEHVGFWRGHWRAFYVQNAKDELGRNVVDYGRVGKNRAGTYDVKGYTWVTEHFRGDPALAEIKTHVIRTNTTV